MSGLLLDTNAFIRIVLGMPMKEEAQRSIVLAVVSGNLWVSAVSAWEIGMLTTSTRTGRQLQVTGDPVTWFEAGRAKIRVQALPLATEEALRAAFLPEPFHKDPADRLLVAQARAHDLTVVTRDRAILDYAALGHVRAIAC
jgi:PIN domain nuclease of toxin-antitoxin system